MTTESERKHTAAMNAAARRTLRGVESHAIRDLQRLADVEEAARAMLAALTDLLRLADRRLDITRRSSVGHPAELDDNKLPSPSEAQFREAARAAIAQAEAAGITR